MPYVIKDYTKQKARQLGVVIKPSNNPKYKLDVYNTTGELITRVGATGYKDYPTYILENGKEYADKRRELYKKRHEKDRKVIGSRGYYADKLLW